MWFKVDDSFYDHPKAIGLSDGAIAVWTRAGSWSGHQLTDGAVPLAIVAQFTVDAEAVAAELIDHRLWEPAEGGGIQYHDWLDYNPSREKVLAKRKADAERRARWLASRRDSDSGQARHGVSHGVTDHGVSHGVTRADHAVSHTSPTRPDPTLSRVGVGEDARASDAEGWTPHDALSDSSPPARKASGEPPPRPARMRPAPPPAGSICPRCSKTSHRAEDCPERQGAAADDRALVGEVGGPAAARKLLAARADADEPPAEQLALTTTQPAAIAARTPQPGDADWTPPF